MAAFLAIPLIVLLVVSIGTMLFSERLTRENALAGARDTAVRMTRFLVAPVLLEALNGVPGRWDELDRRVQNRLRDGSIATVLIWNRYGNVLYSSHHESTGMTAAPSRDLLAAVGGKVMAGVASEPELGYPGHSLGRLVEVYVPLKVRSPDLVLETYFGYEAVQRAGRLLRNQILPIAVGALVLLQVVQVPLGVSLFRRVRRQDVEQSELLARTLTASDRERRAIAADVHDGPVQDLAGVGYALSALQLTVPSLGRGTIDGPIGSVREAVAGLRTLMVDLYPPDLSASAMPAALEDLAHQLGTGTFAVQVDATAVPGLSSLGAAALYRTAKEALAVVPRQGAVNAWLSYGPVTMDGAPAALLRVSHDGLPAARNPTRPPVDDLEGLDLMRRELVDLGGSLTVTDHDGSGAVVTGVVPVVATPHSGGPPPPHRGVRWGIRVRETVLSPLRRQPPGPSRTQ